MNLLLGGRPAALGECDLTTARQLAEDLAYLDGLAGGGEVTLPEGRRSATQKQIHERNLATASTTRR